MIRNPNQTQEQNLIRQTRIEKIEPLPGSYRSYKQVILDVCGILAAFFAGYAYFEFIGGSWSLLAPLGALLLLIVIFTLTTLLEKNIWRRMIMLILDTAALLAPFYVFSPRILGIVAAITFILLWTGYLQGRSALDHDITIRFFNSTHGTAAKTMTAGLLIGIILYLPRGNIGMVFFDKSEFAVIFNWAADIANKFYPDISLAGSFEAFSMSIAQGSLSDNATFRAMSPDDQKSALSAATAQVEGNIAKALGVAPRGSDSVSDVTYSAVSGILQKWYNRSAAWFTAIWCIVLFLALRSIGVVVVWIGQIFDHGVVRTASCGGSHPHQRTGPNQGSGRILKIPHPELADFVVAGKREVRFAVLYKDFSCRRVPPRQDERTKQDPLREI